MHYDAYLNGLIKEAMKQAARNLGSLRMIKAETDPEILRLMDDLRPANPKERPRITDPDRKVSRP